jgi:hypothetical protein
MVASAIRLWQKFAEIKEVPMRSRLTRALFAALVAAALLLAGTAPFGQPGPTRATLSLPSGDQ